MDVVTLRASFSVSVDAACSSDVVGDDDNCCNYGPAGDSFICGEDCRWIKNIDDYISESSDQLVVLPTAPSS
jgi:hypothetical protein